MKRKLKMKGTTTREYLFLESDVKDKMISQFITKVNGYHGSQFCMVTKTYHKLIDELKRVALNVQEIED